MTAPEGLRERATAVFVTYLPKVQDQHQAAWARCEARVRSLLPAGTENWEIALSVGYARDLYMGELAKGSPADLCERHVMQAYSTG